MHVRLATPDDVKEMASVAVAAYAYDPQDAYIYPRRHAHPNLFLKVKSDFMHHSFEDPAATSIVAVLDEDDQGWEGHPTVVGYCLWYLQAPESQHGRDEEETKEPMIKRLTSYIMDSEIADYVRDLLNPIIDASHSRAIAQVCRDPNSRRFNDGYVRPNSFYGIYEIGVDPKFQRRGVARLMIAWGMQRSDKEQIPIHLSATPAGQPLYASLGFQTVGWWVWRPKQDDEWEIMQRDCVVEISAEDSAV
ncbi:hypothetical protein NM208_g2706 [Fusarium decemcellulare]|uniref:Uncharacterized protein n=1 Tax=Fusarium decemcellulare TaxID=57161 RepID=A0ACC1SRH6_9HYPO|nr:hypothetical protein NM208_g2706 [Fusarium decemcellulare]